MWIQVQLYTTLHTQQAHVTYFIKIYDELKDHFVFLFFYLWSKKKNVLKTEKNLFGQGFVCTLVLDYSSFKFASSQFSYFKPHPPSRWSFSNFKSYIIHETFFCVCLNHNMHQKVFFSAARGRQFVWFLWWGRQKMKKTKQNRKK